MRYKKEATIVESRMILPETKSDTGEMRVERGQPTGARLQLNRGSKF